MISNVDKANVFAKAFNKNYNLTVNQPSSFDTPVNYFISELNKFTHFSFSKFITKPKELKQLIKRLKSNKSPGTDTITNRILKNLPNKALNFLATLFNKCFKLGYFPSCWKSSIVVAISKPNKDPSNPNSYRPIYLLNSLSKLLEKVFSD